MSNKMFPVSLVLLFVMLGFILWPNVTNLGDLFSFAKNFDYKGIPLSQLFFSELVILLTVWLVLSTYKKGKSIVYGDEYMIRHCILLLFVTGQVFMGFFAGGIVSYQDVTSSQTAHEVSNVMESQAVIFMVCYPLYLFFGGTAFIYARTRLPEFLSNKRVPFMMLTFAPMAFLPYYDASIGDFNKSVFEWLYRIDYWLLSIAWVVIGVFHIAVSASKEIYKGLSNPYEEM
ncbi:MAG: hypothetical protein COB22_04580 [Cycloclasticus sp.]|nr:MAG: hypothetical protein COB22_04580 [Cycloclasticus sp.]